MKLLLIGTISITIGMMLLFCFEIETAEDRSIRRELDYWEGILKHNKAGGNWIPESSTLREAYIWEIGRLLANDHYHNHPEYFMRDIEP